LDQKSLSWGNQSVNFFAFSNPGRLVGTKPPGTGRGLIGWQVLKNNAKKKKRTIGFNTGFKAGAPPLFLGECSVFLRII